MPEWVEALGDVTPDRALLISDEWDDEYFVWIDFLCPDGGVRWLGVDVDRLWTGWARGFVHGPMGEEMLNRISDSPPGTLREISLSDSRAIIEAGLRERDATWRFEEDEDESEDGGRYEFDEDLRALVDQRIGLLPTGGDAGLSQKPSKHEVDDLVAEFAGLASEEDSAAWAVVAKTICSFSLSCYKSDPLLWSPRKMSGLVTEWMVGMGSSVQEQRIVMELVFPRWFEFTAEKSELSAEMRDMSLHALQQLFETMRGNPADLRPWGIEGS